MANVTTWVEYGRWHARVMLRDMPDGTAERRFALLSDALPSDDPYLLGFTRVLMDHRMNNADWRRHA